MWAAATSWSRLAILAQAQDIQADRVSVHLSNPSHPASVKANLKNVELLEKAVAKGG